MNALVIFAHPDRQSLNAALLNQAIEGLESNPRIAETRILDLYAIGFDPVLRFGEGKSRRDMHRDPAFSEYRKAVSWADRLVFVYPIWWGRAPAILMGFFDQVFASGFAYRTQPKSPFPEGLLKGKEAVCIFTMKGPAFYPRLLLNNAHQVLMRRAVFQFVGIRRVKFLGFGGMENAGRSQEKALAKVRARMERMSA